MTKPTQVVIEAGSRRVFACAVSWPGWCRSGKTEQAALEALANYAPRYAVVAKRAGVAFPARVGESFEVVERLKGGPTTDFGAPEAVAELDREPLTPAQAKRMAGLVAAAWHVFDEVAATAPAELRKGPRGGGRDRDKIIEHVLSAEVAYARKLGLKLKVPAIADVEAIEAVRKEIAAVLSAPSDGGPRVERGWPVRYAARRIAWHVLDHAWEMLDRSQPAP